MSNLKSILSSFHLQDELNPKIWASSNKMSPKVREESEKVVVTAIVAVGAAVNAATGAAMMAAPASASSNIIRRNT